MADRCKRGGNSEGYSVVLRFILVLVLAVLVRGARVTSRIRERVSAPVLRFGKDGTFKIVQV